VGIRSPIPQHFVNTSRNEIHVGLVALIGRLISIVPPVQPYVNVSERVQTPVVHISNRCMGKFKLHLGI
jgi:hypothetical protein